MLCYVDSSESFHWLYTRIVKAFSFTKTTSMENNHATPDTSPTYMQLLRELQKLLRMHEADLLRPLRYPKPDPESRRKVESSDVSIRGNKLKLPQEFIQIAIQLSDELQLNEIECVKLLYAAKNILARFDNDLYAAAIYLYNEERQDLLTSLLTLLQGRNDTNIPDSLHALIDQTTKNLFKQGLVSELTQLILDLTAQITKESKRRTVFTSERRRVAECLFYACYQIQSRPNDALAVLAALKSQLKLAKPPQQPAQNVVPDTPSSQDLLQICFILAMSLHCLIDPFHDVIDPDKPDSQPENNFLYTSSGSQSFITEFQQSVLDGNSWADKGFQGFIALSWSLSMLYSYFNQQTNKLDIAQEAEKSVKKAFNQAIDNDVFMFLADSILSSKWFEEDKYNKEFFTSTLSELARNLLSKLPECIMDVIDFEDQTIRTYEEYRYALSQMQYQAPLQQQQQPPALPREDVEDLLRFIAKLHKGYPELADHFLNRENIELYQFVVQTVPKFMTDLMEGLDRIHESFGPYMEMLKAFAHGSDQNALEIFTMLKESNFSLVSWDHFFNIMHQFIRESDEQQRLAQFQQQQSQYGGYYDQQLQPTVQLSDEDENAMFSILQVMEEVVRYSPQARIIMIENQNWNVLNTLFSLMQCQISSKFMGQVMRCLAAFALLPDVAAYIWDVLDNSEVLSREGGVKIQLEKQSKAEEYQELLGFLDLVQSVLTHGIHHMVSASGVPGSGFTPYLQFILNDVLIKADSRKYQDESERWRITSSCLAIAIKVLADYEPSPSDFLQPAPLAPTFTRGEGSAKSRPYQVPGFELMKDLLSRYPSQLYKRLCAIICGGYGTTIADARGAQQLQAERFDSTKYGALREKCILQAFKLVDTCMAKQTAFIHISRTVQQQQQQPLQPQFQQAQPQTLVLTELNRLIVDDPSLVVHIAYYIGYEHSAEIRWFAVRTLFTLSQVEHKLVGIFMLRTGDFDAIMKIFVERLRGTDELEHSPEYFDSNVDIRSTPTTTEDMNLELARVDDTERDKMIENSVRNAILELLLYNIDASPDPQQNLTYFLCGYETSHEQTVLRDTGRETCLTVVLALLKSPHFSSTHPRLAEHCYELLYRLCADTKVSATTLSFLGRLDFFCKHLLRKEYIEIAPNVVRGPNVAQAIHQLNQRAYVLKTTALEIFSSTSMDVNKHRGGVQAVLRMLFSNNIFGQEEENEAAGATFGEEAPLEQHKTQMLELLDTIDLWPSDRPPMFEFSILTVPANIHELCLEPAISSGKNIQLYNVKALHHYLNQAKKSFEQGSGGSISSGSLQRIDAEIKQALNTAVQWNKFFQKYAAISNVFEGWRQVVEITLSQCYDMLDEESRERVLYELLNTLLFKLSTSKQQGVARQSVAVMSNQLPLAKSLESAMSHVILRIMTKLREQRLPMDTSDRSQISRLPVDQCHTILNGILNCILREGTSAVTRGNLYATLLNYIQYTRKLPVLSVSAANSSTMPDDYSYRAIVNNDSQELLEGGNEQLLNTCAADLLQCISRDALDGAKVWKAVAFATLDALFSFERHVNRWINILNDRGLFQQFLDDFTRQAKTLESILNPEIVSLNNLYVYENKMSFFIKVSETVPGAETLVDYGVISRLAGFRFIDDRPEDSDNLMRDDEGWLPSIAERYYQLLVPVLRLLVSIFTSLRKNRKVAEQVLDFVMAHNKVLSAILKDRQKSSVPLIPQSANLEQIWLITSLFYLLSFHQESCERKLKTKNRKYQTILLNLLVKYTALNERGTGAVTDQRNADEDFTMSSYTPASHDASIKPLAHKETTEERLIRDIFKNVIAFCRVTTEFPPNISLTSRLLFTPTMSGDTTDDFQRVLSRGQQPSLNVLWLLLKQGIKQCINAHQECNRAKSNLSRIDELSPQQLAQEGYLDASVMGDALSGAAAGITTTAATGSIADLGLTGFHQEQIKLIAEINLSQSIANRTKQLSAYLYIIENALLVLWRHLNHFLSDSRPFAITGLGSATSASSILGSSSFGRLSSSFNTIATSSMIGDGGTSPADIGVKLSPAETEKLIKDANKKLKQVLEDILTNDELFMHGIIQTLALKIKDLITFSTASSSSSSSGSSFLLGTSATNPTSSSSSSASGGINGMQRPMLTTTGSSFLAPATTTTAAIGSSSYIGNLGNLGNGLSDSSNKPTNGGNTSGNANDNSGIANGFGSSISSGGFSWGAPSSAASSTKPTTSVTAAAAAAPATATARSSFSFAVPQPQASSSSFSSAVPSSSSSASFLNATTAAAGPSLFLTGGSTTSRNTNTNTNRPSATPAFSFGF